MHSGPLTEHTTSAKTFRSLACMRYTGSMPTVVILAGPNGAGKSTAAPTVVAELLAIGAFVNADTIARGLSAFDSESVAMQAGRIMLQRLHELATQRADFAFETTLASRSFAPFLEGLRRSGYRVELVYVWLPSSDLCIQRVHARRRSGGHFVDEDVVRRRYTRSLQNFFNLYQSLADDWQVYENSGGSEARPVAEGSGLRTSLVHDLRMWNLMREQGPV